MTSPPTSGSWALAQVEDRLAVRPSGCTFHTLDRTFPDTPEGRRAAENYIADHWPAGAEIRVARVTVIPR
jgi:hypothetical protein